MLSKLDLEKDAICPDGQVKSESAAVAGDKGRAITGFRVKILHLLDWSATKHFG